MWRCGNRGNVASVLIEKPARGDFLPILDGGFSLQYSPLLEYREGQGMVLFCQMDVTGRTEQDPAAEIAGPQPARLRGRLAAGAAAPGRLRRRRRRASSTSSRWALPCDPSSDGKLSDERRADRRLRRRSRTGRPRGGSRQVAPRRAATCWPSDSTSTRPTPSCRSRSP